MEDSDDTLDYIDGDSDNEITVEEQWPWQMTIYLTPTSIKTYFYSTQ